MFLKQTRLDRHADIQTINQPEVVGSIFEFDFFFKFVDT